MKLFYLIIFLFSEVFSGQIWTESLDEAKKLAIQNNKFIIIDFNASWCSPCRQMESDFWYNSKFTSTLDKFIIVSVNIDFNKNIANYYGVTSIPNVKIIDVNGNLIHEFLGYINAEKTNLELEGFPNNTEDLYQTLVFEDKKKPTDEELLALATSYQLLIQKSTGIAKSSFEKLSNYNFNKCAKLTKKNHFAEISQLGILFNGVLNNKNKKTINSLDPLKFSDENKSFA